MEKSIINLNYKIEVLSKNQSKQQILDSLHLVSNNPELVISKKIKSDVFIESITKEENPEKIDPVYVDYFRFFKKN